MKIAKLSPSDLHFHKHKLEMYLISDWGDVWKVGCIAVFMLCLYYIFSGRNDLN